MVSVNSSTTIGGLAKRIIDALNPTSSKMKYNPMEQYLKFLGDDEVKYDFDEAPVAGGGTTLVEVRDWDDTWGGMVGARYSLNPTFIMSVGYLHEENPIPDKTFEPLIPDTDKDMFSIGLQKIIGKYNIAFTYIYALYDDRDKNNLVGAEFGSTANGEYSQDAHFLSGAVKIEF